MWRGWTAVALVALGAAWGQASCATGSSGEDDAGPASSQSSGGSGGLGGVGGVGGAGGLGGGAGGESCSEQPCKLLPPQCGCPSGEACQFVGGMRSCGVPGDKSLSEACTPGECMSGHTCSAPPSNIGGPNICFKFCQDDTDCTAPGGQCIFTLPGDSVKLCSQNCDPISDQGCLDTSMKCYLLTNNQTMLQLTSCGAAGAGIEGSACTTPSDCGKGLMCVNDPNTMATTCRKWCAVSAPNCATCVGLSPPVVLGVLEYGVCL